MYETTVFRSEGPDAKPPETLPPGPYAFYARAFDEQGLEVAQGCRAVTFPRKDTVLIELDGPTTSCEAPTSDDWGSSQDRPSVDGEAPVGPRLQLAQAEYLAGQSVSVQFFEVTKPGEPVIRLFDRVTNQVLASAPVPFKGKEEVASGTLEFASPPPGVYAAQLAYKDLIASEAEVTVLADRDGDQTPDSADGCGDDPFKSAPGTCGCGTPDTDSDADAVPDCMDGCPSDKLKAEAGFCGCGFLESFSDQDGDALADCYDACPTDPTKQRPLVCGCGASETDTDADATPDCKDECPTSPTKAQRGACGCDVADTDGDADKTPDCNDGCPTDPKKVVPGTCGCGVREPFDVASFRDAKGKACSKWKGLNCTLAVEKYGYTLAQENAILANCSLTCGGCP